MFQVTKALPTMKYVFAESGLSFSSFYPRLPYEQNHPSSQAGEADGWKLKNKKNSAVRRIKFSHLLPGSGKDRRNPDDPVNPVLKI
jgi:hypothetical protein